MSQVKFWIIGILLANSLCFFSACQPEKAPQNAPVTTAVDFSPLKYTPPNSYADTTQIDNYFGMDIRDPYRWLERNSPSTQDWVKAQQAVTEDYLHQIPFRSNIKERVKALWNYEKRSVPKLVNKYFYYLINDGLQNQSVLVRARTMSESPELVLNPNSWSEDGSAALGSYEFSGDGHKMAFTRSEGGSDWKTIQVMDLQTNQLLADKIEHVKFSNIAWWKDGFFYSRYPSPTDNAMQASNTFHQLCYHRLGQPQSEDEIYYMDRRFAQRNVQAQTTKDQQFLVLSTSESTSGNALYIMDLNDDAAGFTPVVEGFEHDFVLVGSQGQQLWFWTNHNAPNGRLIQVNAQKSSANFWEELIPESDRPLRSVQHIDGKFIAHYLNDVSSSLSVFSLDGEKTGDIDLPPFGTITALSGKTESGSPVFASYTSLTQPACLLELDPASGGSTMAWQPKTVFKADDYETKQIKYKSYDGTEIPMFIVHKKGLKPGKDTPCMLYGYGGFDIPVLPTYNRTRLQLFPVILEQGGVCAVANIRGGGEYGAAWHKAGTKLAKQNVFDDFMSAAEYLVANGYTSRGKLGIYGRSNGGLLVGACITQRPDLYAVAFPAVGVLDMLRYHKFTIGWAWAGDYGTSDNTQDFDNLISYSPLHNVHPDRYPATMVTTAAHDDRVVPAHSFKFAAALQQDQRADRPVLLRVADNAGHGAGTGAGYAIEEATDVLSFFFFNTQTPFR